jgi:hypothetical protein
MNWWNNWWNYSGHWNGGGGTTSVPEIDASTGLLALAAAVAILAFAWERRRRQS